MKKLPLLEKIELSELSELTELNEDVLMSLEFKNTFSHPHLYSYHYDFEGKESGLGKNYVWIDYFIYPKCILLWAKYRNYDGSINEIQLHRDKFLLNDLYTSIKLVLNEKL